MGAPIIKSGLNTSEPMVFAKTRQGQVIGVNGIDRGIFWDGRTSAADELGIDSPMVSPTIYTPTQGDVSASATITIASTDVDGKFVTIVDSEKKTISYYFDKSVQFNNKALSKGSYQATVPVGGLGSTTEYASALMYAIRSSFGHKGTLTVSQASNELTITMKAGGASQNGVTITDDAGANITSTAFANGKTLGGSAYATIALNNNTNADYANDTITLISTDGTTKVYKFVNSGTAVTGSLDGTDVVVQLNGIAADDANFALQLQAAIISANGHNGKILVGVSGDDLTLYQAVAGTAGNKTISHGITSATVSSAFTGGSNAGGASRGNYVCYYRYVDDRDGERYYSNFSVASRVTTARDDKFEWSGLMPPPQARVNKVQLLRSTFNSATVFYVVAELPAGGNVTSATDSSGSMVLTIEKGHGLIPGCSVTVSGTTGSTGNCHNNIWIVSSVTETTATMITTCNGGSSTGGVWKIEGFYNDTLQDATMVAYRGAWRVKALQNNGRPNANRHSVPPNFKKVCCNFQDRMTYLVDVEYSKGTVTGTLGESIVTGTGTDWPRSLTGRTLCPDASADCGTYSIKSVTNTGELVLSKPLEHTFENIAYTINSPSSERNTIYISEQDLPESVSTQIVLQENIRDEDNLVGAVVMGTSYYALKEHSIYRITWASQPAIDAQPTLAAMRGAINHFCADQHEGSLYLMDDEGPYIFQGNSVNSIGVEIQNQWSDQVLDFSKKSTWKVRVDPLEEVVYFYVTAVGDSGSKPKRAFVYDIRTKTWTQWKYVWEIADATKISYNNQRRVALGATTEKIYVQNEGFLDGTIGDGTVTGTVTSASENTLSDTTETTSFPVDCEGASIAIISGTGIGQIVKITKRVSGKELEVESWSTTPDSTSVYLIGAVEWMWKSGMFKLAEGESKSTRYFRVVFQPTTNDASLYFKKYDNHSSSPVQMNEWDNGDGVSIKQGDTRAIADLKISQKEDAEEPGIKYLPWSVGIPSVRGNPVRWVTCEMSGFQGLDRIQLYELEIGGVEE
tara:strand:- start:318 stop:3392 length:3075 start_codon:yes stop_codon:yes gene_type:complete